MRRIEIVAYRDPDADTDFEVFVDGKNIDGIPVTVTITDVDPGAGYDRTEWREARDLAAEESSPAAAATIREFYNRGERSGHITGDGESVA